MAAWLKTASRWVAADGVTVNGVLPGRFGTPRIRELDEARATRESRPVEHVQARGTHQRPGADAMAIPDELGAVIAFLASEPAAYINGALVPVDGGMLQSLG